MDVIMPQLGETVAEGKVSSWFKAVGDAVAAGDNLFEIETDKVTMEVQATVSGVLAEIRVGAGETVPVGTIVAVLGAAGAKPAPRATAPAAAPSPTVVAAPTPAPAAPPPVAAPARERNGAAPFTLAPFAETRTPQASYGPAAAPFGLKITPLARRLIRQAGLDLAAVAKSVEARGGWRIAAADVTAHADGAGSKSKPSPQPGSGGIEPLNRIRAQTAARLTESWRSIPHAFQAVEVDFSAIARARREKQAEFLARHGVTLTYLPFVARAIALALAEFPRLNASFETDRLVLHRDIHLGVAVDLGHDGLIVPVVHHADEMTVSGLAKAIARQVEKARSATLTPDDVTGATYSLTNNGSFGTLFTMPIINLPQVAILSFDAVQKRAVAIAGENGDAIAVRPVAMLGQSFDHRALDGAYSAAFLKRLKAIAENRDWAADFG